MTNEEKLLKSLRLREPSDSLNRRMGQLFAGVPATQAMPARRRSVPLWQAVAAAVIGVGMGWMIRPVPPTAPPSASTNPAVHYIVIRQTTGPRDVFDWTQYPAVASPRPASAKGWSVVTPQTSDIPGDARLPANRLFTNGNGNRPTQET